MDKTKKYFGIVCVSFQNIYAETEMILKSKEPDQKVLRCNVEMLEKKVSSLVDLHDQLIGYMLDEACDERVILQEVEIMDDVNRKYKSIKISIDQLFNSDAIESVKSNKTSLKLPKIEFVKFCGDIKNWLTFWSQFKRIDEDEDMALEDKFQYLIQATTPKSRARHLVESYPPTRDNYPKAIESLKSRFGRDDLLIKFYVRELLKLVLNNLNTKSSLTKLYDSIESQLRSLETLGVTSDKYAAMLYPMVESCLPEEVLRAWQRSNNYDIKSSLKSRLDVLVIFLRKEVENEERISLAVSGFDYIKKKPSFSNQVNRFNIPTASGLLNQKKDLYCIFCNKNHIAEDCNELKTWSYDQKIKFLTDKGRCHKCLKFGHIAKKCHVKVFCSTCKERHATIVCSKNLVNTNVGSNSVDQVDSLTVDTLSNNTFDGTFLQTLVVNATNGALCRYVRAIVNTGSQRSYISKSLVSKLGYESVGVESVIHALFGGFESHLVTHNIYKLNLVNADGNYSCNFDVLDQPLICRNVVSVRDGPWVKELQEKGIVVTDTHDGPIEILIGADVAGRLFTGKRLVLSSGLVAMETRLGWVLMGKVPQTPGNIHSNSMVVISLLSMDASIQNLWNLDVLGIVSPEESMSTKDKEHVMWEQFVNDIRIDSEGRYEVGLCWVNDHPPLPSNFSMAKRRLDNLMLKLEKDGYYDLYDEVFREWLAKGVIEEVPEDKIGSVEVGHYLPHRHVIKLSSQTSKLRPVFDASARIKSAPSLNMCIEKCLNLLELIPSILLRFRLERLGVISDIRRAFLQISLMEEDRDYLKFLWYDVNGKLKTYRHRRVVFGVTCSPFLLNAVIQFHLQNILVEIRKGIDVFSEDIILKLLESFYVDNAVTSVKDEEQLKCFMSQATQAMNLAKFELRCWEHTVLGDQVLGNVISPVLDLNWNRHRDTLLLNMEWFQDIKLDMVTKRLILSIAHRLFDPIGFSCPVQLVPRILLQKTWVHKIGWDVEVPDDIKKEFLDWVGDLSILAFLEIPRWVLKNPVSGLIHQSFHLFCDASQQAYGSVVFLRTESASGVVVELVAAKNRVCPIKKLSICRLELLAVTLGSRLLSFVLKNLPFGEVDVYCWTDSTTVLSWIGREDMWKPFVWNRVKEIRTLTRKEDWYHVAGSLNPADLVSRGCSPKRLVQSSWWEGPSWLLDISKWPLQKYVVEEELVSKEKRNTLSSLLNAEVDYSVFSRYFSKYSQIVNLLGWIRRFMYNCLNKNKRRHEGYLLKQERDEAEKMVIKCIQEESFKGVDDRDIVCLHPFLDSDRIIRIKTRILQRDDSVHFLTPILLPGQHPVVQRMVYQVHCNNGHAGVQTLLSILRENFWIVKGRKNIRRILLKCTVYRRFDSKKFDTPSVVLPRDRVKNARAFEIVGVDLTGPLFLKNGDKVWLCLFTCSVYRAVHLEVVLSCSTESFLNCLRRFIARRGRPSIIYSDNGTNFVGCGNILSSLDWDNIHQYSSVEKIEWRFNPPAAAWWGGFWERLMRILKQILRKVLGKSCLNYEEISTVICDCEAIMNSRPLTYTYSSNKDLLPLTPAMFIQDIAEIQVPDLDKAESVSLQKHLKRKQHLVECIRKRFRNEYLGQLVFSNKKLGTRSITKGEVVLIESEKSKKIDWPLGIIHEVVIGKDGKVRMVTVKTSKGILSRPVQRLYPLEVFAADESEYLKEVYDILDNTDLPKQEKEELSDDELPAATTSRKPVKITRYGREVKKVDRYGY